MLVCLKEAEPSITAGKKETLLTLFSGAGNQNVQGQPIFIQPIFVY